MTETLADSPETRFIGLMSELFQLREAEELDFGIYRVIRRHNRQVRAFLGEIVEESGQPVLHGGELAGILEQAFQQIDGETRDEKKAQLQRMADELGIKAHCSTEEREHYLAGVEKIPAMRQQVMDYRNLREELETTYSASADRSEVLNRLYEFFSRHYQDGDFIVQRRYGRNGARYIKSSGEDTEFHWATEDMYYIKSGDIFTDYPVRLSNGQRLVFCVDADTLNQTRAELKPTDKASYKLRAIQEKDSAIRVTLDYLKGAQRTRAQLDEIISRAAAVSRGQPEEIARHLRRYIARNQSDFFIHKRLQEALDDDLDIFLKTDVLNADQLLADDAGHIPARALRVARAIRRVGRRINAFLGVLEDYQKRLWEKKKLVLSTRYIITLDRLDKLAGRAFVEANLAAILANAAQVAEWQALGLGELTTVEAVQREDGGFLPLPVDTLHFGEDFKWALLAAVTKDHPLDESLDGVAIHSDNWQALNTMQEKYGERVKCVYIDPPYNTNSSGIPYKNGYQHASWGALMHNRIELLRRLLPQTGAIFVSIDKAERTLLSHVMDSIFDASNRIEELIWVQNTNNSQSPTYSTNHEYVEVYAKSRLVVERVPEMFREPKPGFAEMMELVARLNPGYPSIKVIESEIRALFNRHLDELKEQVENQGLEWETEKENDPWRGLYNYCHAEYRDDDGKLVSEAEAKERQAKIWIWQEGDASAPAAKQADSTRKTDHSNYRFYKPLHPITGKLCPHPKSGWKFPQFADSESPSRINFESLVADNRIAWGMDENKVPRLKRMLHEVETNVGKSVFRDFSDGEKQLSAMFGQSGLFLAPKHTRFVDRFIQQTTAEQDWVLDCFGGSGSSAHAVLEANLEGCRFHTS